MIGILLKYFIIKSYSPFYRRWRSSWCKFDIKSRCIFVQSNAKCKLFHVGLDFFFDWRRLERHYYKVERWFERSRFRWVQFLIPTREVWMNSSKFIIRFRMDISLIGLTVSEATSSGLNNIILLARVVCLPFH